MTKSLIPWVALFAVCSAGLFAFNGCSTVPITGRQQLNLISPGQEMQLGLSSFEQMKKEVPVSRDAAANALVQRVGQRIAAAAANHLPNAQWEFVVFQSKEANAFCLPGGKIGVYTGILPITKDEAGLATVLGHEVAHASAHHGAERMSEALLANLGGQLLGIGLSKSDPKTQAAMATVYGLGSQLGVALPHSRNNESEADAMGLIYMARAGYNPEAAVAFWERFAEATRAGDTGLWFLRTHPVTTDRIQHIKELLPRAKAEFKSAPR
ncbi:MAG: M48 family metallopeptidase [Verrucomicrobia bacterium]|nr:M48 family metallopeptidase [Verrucomicrobiota bacterium]